ncbi:MAG: hypothetical protein ACKOWW_03905 [Flavobacteriales bacterium]
MKVKNCIYLLFILSFFATKCVGQIEQQLVWQEFQENPVMLDSSHLQLLQEYHLLDSSQVAILKGLLRSNHLKSFYQLQSYACFELGVIQKLALVTYISPDLSNFDKKVWQIQANYNGTFILRLSMPVLVWSDHVADTTIGNSYLGNQFALQQKFQIQCTEHFKFTLNSAKDRGEVIGVNDKQTGIDFLTASFFYKANTQVAKLAIGAYQFQWGQGLQLWTTRAMGRSIDLLQSVRIAQGLQAYNGADEQRYLNGISIQWNVASQEFYGISSRKLIDVPSTQDTLALEFGSLNSSGLHRTNLEWQRKDQLQESLFGAGWQCKKANYQLGALLLYQNYAPSKHTDSLGQIFLLHRPTDLMSIGFQCKGNIRQSFCFVEMVQLYRKDQPLKYTNAIIFGALLPLHSKVQLAFNFRYYGLYYTAFYEQGFHAKNLAQNERGIFLSLTYQLLKKWKWQSYIDQYSFPQLTAVAFAQRQTLFRTQLLYSRSKSSKMQFSFQKSFGQNSSLLRIEAQSEYKRQLTLNTGAQIGFLKGGQRSYSVFYTMQFQKLGMPLRFILHIGSYLVPPVFSAHYQMNYQLGFGTATLQLTGQGYFSQQTISYQINQKFNLSLRTQLLFKMASSTPELAAQTYQTERMNFQIDLQFKYHF